MRIYEVRISEEIAEKIQAQHGVLPEDAEEILFSQPVVRRARDGRYWRAGNSPSSRLRSYVNPKISIWQKGDTRYGYHPKTD
jgi:hypothetical protein